VELLFLTTLILSKLSLRFSVDTINKKVELTFRSGNLSKSTRSTLSLSDFQEGQKIKGGIKRIVDYGLFVEIEGSKVSGLCHKSEVRANRALASLALLKDIPAIGQQGCGYHPSPAQFPGR
jgi:polyribonucleotide nucleotidyltransferase